MGAEHHEVAIHTEQEQTPPESLRTLAAAGKISDKFAEAALEAYFPSHRLPPTSRQAELSSRALTTYSRPENQAGRFRQMMQRVKGALERKPTKNRLETLADEIDELRLSVPLPVTYEVDDETPSSEIRGRVYTRVAFPKEELDEMLRRDGLTLQVDAVSHRVRITTADGKVMDARMPFMLEGSRFYADEENQRYLFERLSLLNPDQQTRYGKMSRTDRDNVVNQLGRITNPTRNELESGLK